MTAVNAKSFRSQLAFRAWLRKHGGSVSELFVRCYRVEHRAHGLTYREALDEALCFGWIDGVRYGLDEVSFATVAPRWESGASQKASTSGCRSSAAWTMPRWTPRPRPWMNRTSRRPAS